MFSVDIERGSPSFELNAQWKCVGGGRFRWPCVLRRSSGAALMLESRVRIPLRPWMFVCCECRRLLCMLPADHSFRRVVPSVCVSVCDVETTTMRRPWSELGCRMTQKNCNILQEKCLSLICYIFIWISV